MKTKNKINKIILLGLLTFQTASASEITGTLNTTLGSTLTATVITPTNTPNNPPSGGGGGGGSSSGGGGGGGWYSPNHDLDKNKKEENKKTEIKVLAQEEKSKNEVEKINKTASISDNLKLGSSGDSVKNLQKILIKNGLLNSEATGYFGKLTQSALIKFQTKNKLPATGILNTETLALLTPTDIPVVISDISPNSTTFKFSKNLSTNSKNTDVKELQKILIANGFLKTEATGYFGKLTKEALIKWQRKNNLPATGYFGEMTRNLINKK